MRKVTIGLLQFSQMFRKYTQGVYMVKSVFFENSFSKYQYGLCNRCNIQTALVCIVEKMLIARDKEEVSETISTALSKAFDCISQYLIRSKLHTYRFDWNLL